MWHTISLRDRRQCEPDVQVPGDGAALPFPADESLSHELSQPAVDGGDCRHFARDRAQRLGAELIGSPAAIALAARATLAPHEMISL